MSLGQTVADMWLLFVQNLVRSSIAVLKIRNFHCYVSLAWNAYLRLSLGCCWGKNGENETFLQFDASRNAITWNWCLINQIASKRAKIMGSQKNYKKTISHARVVFHPFAKFYDNRFTGFGVLIPNFVILHRSSWSPLQQCMHYRAAASQLVTWPTRHMWRVDLLILHSAWRVDHTCVTSWLLVGRVVGSS